MTVGQFQYNNGRVTYEISGNGVPIVFIHPPAMGRIVFKKQTALEHYFTVIFPDLSGNGDSAGKEEKITIEGYAGEINALLTHLGIEKAVVCGYSAGGTVAQEFALRFPERTLALILLSGYPEVLSPSFKYEHLIGMYLVERFPNFLINVIAFSHTDEREWQKEIIYHMKKANHKVWYQWYEQSLSYSCIDRLDELSVPLLLIYGARDFANSHIRAYKKHLPYYEAVIIPGVSHQLPIKKGKTVNQAIIGFVYERLNSLVNAEDFKVNI